MRVLGLKECEPKADSPGAQRVLGVEVELTSWDEWGVPANYFYAHLEDPEGGRTPSQEGCEPALVGPPLRPGKQSRGFLSFAFPAAERGVLLVYAPRLPEASPRADKARIAIPLGDRD